MNDIIIAVMRLENALQLNGLSGEFELRLNKEDLHTIGARFFTNGNVAFYECDEVGFKDMKIAGHLIRDLESK